jgi:GH25 family lysozyme M1 (1,4-beta-N-acetylmuramidase)
MIRVLDISAYQHPGPAWPNGAPIDFAAVKASGVTAVIIKATEGADYTNPYFVQDRAAARAAGLKVGAYHFARPSRGGAWQEAQHFLAVAGRGLDFYIDDSEDPDAAGWDLRAWSLTFLQTVEQGLGGVIPWLYSYRPYLVATLKGDARFARYPLWEAAYTTAPPVETAPWGGWQMWQYTDAAQIPGIVGAVDESVLAGALPQEIDVLTDSLKRTLVRLAAIAGLGHEPSPAQLDMFSGSIKDDGSNVEAIITSLLDSPEGVGWGAHLQVIAAQGLKGDPGPQGDPGKDGAAVVAPGTTITATVQ